MLKLKQGLEHLVVLLLEALELHQLLYLRLLLLHLPQLLLLPCQLCIGLLRSLRHLFLRPRRAREEPQDVLGSAFYCKPLGPPASLAVRMAPSFSWRLETRRMKSAGMLPTFSFFLFLGLSRKPGDTTMPSGAQLKGIPANMACQCCKVKGASSLGHVHVDQDVAALLVLTSWT